MTSRFHPIRAMRARPGPEVEWVLSELGELADHGFDEAIVLDRHGGSVGLVIDRMENCPDPRLR